MFVGINFVSGMLINQLKNRSPFILFLPFLVIYILYVIRFHTDQMEGDEIRYIQFAQNLLHGFYSPASPNIDLINGPGYPILLIPFVALHLPLITITLFHAALHFLSVVYLFKALQLLTSSFTCAIITAICWACYFLAYQEMASILTESFTVFLVAFFSYQVVHLFQHQDIRTMYILKTGIALGMLALTKVIFAYVIVLFMCIGFIIYIRKRTDAAYKKLLLFSVTAFLTLAPYILYTYQLTGKVFYLSTASGEVLYWMTSPNENEYGDWNNHTFTANCNTAQAFCNSELLKKNHEADYDEIHAATSAVEVDALFKKFAIRNIKAHPFKYVKNWFANTGRLLFGFPASYYFQSPTTLVRIYINAVLLLAMTYAFFISLWNWKMMSLEIKILITFSIVYLSLSSLVSAYPRQFNVMIPAVLMWTAYALKNTVQLKLKIGERA